MIDDEARAKIGRVLDAFERTGADYKWVERENLHLTLRFHGEVEEAALPKLKEELAAAARRPPFTVELSCVGAFGGMRNPKLLYLGLTEGAEELKAMAAALGDQDKFKPHLTLGRQRSLKGMGGLSRLLSSYEVDPIAFAVDKIVLVKSTLTPKGPQYEVLSHSGVRL
jgi:2'-5' RNA ligase